jgi:hypothetical protein
MALTVEPDEVHAQLIHVTAIAQWTWEEFLAMYQEVDKLIATQGESDVIINFTLSHHLPVGFSDNAAKMSESFNPSIRTLVLVGTSSAQRVAFEMYRKFFPEQGERYYLVDTMEEAFQLLNLAPSR